MKQAAPDESFFDAPLLVSDAHGKSLYFKGDQLQSQMRSDRPGELRIDYTRTMMGFMLFNSAPHHIAMIGLGGGTLLKFCYHHLPQARFTVLEINPHVIALKEAFEVPDDPQRITMVCGDGADYVRDSASDLEVLLVDGFDSAGQSPSLCSQAFYNDCYLALADHGILVVNLDPEHPEHEVFMGRIALAFDNQVAEVASEEKTNQLVFAQKNKPLTFNALKNGKGLQHLEAATRGPLNLEFKRIAREMKGAG